MRGNGVAGSRLRVGLLSGAIVAGAMLAIATLPLRLALGALDARRSRLTGREHNADMRVLVVEDESKLAKLLVRGLREEGHVADAVGRGEEALWMTRATPYDAIVLDVMLPGLNGFDVCRALRDKGVWTPVLMLTARDAVEDRVEGLDAGADDYLMKPFSFEELACTPAGARPPPCRRAPGRTRGRRPPARPRCAPRMAWRERARLIGEGVRPARARSCATQERC